MCEKIKFAIMEEIPNKNKKMKLSSTMTSGKAVSYVCDMTSSPTCDDYLEKPLITKMLSHSLVGYGRFSEIENSDKLFRVKSIVKTYNSTINFYPEHPPHKTKALYAKFPSLSVEIQTIKHEMPNFQIAPNCELRSAVIKKMLENALKYFDLAFFNYSVFLKKYNLILQKTFVLEYIWNMLVNHEKMKKVPTNFSFFHSNRHIMSEYLFNHFIQRYPKFQYKNNAEFLSEEELSLEYYSDLFKVLEAANLKDKPSQIFNSGEFQVEFSTIFKSLPISVQLCISAQGDCLPLRIIFPETFDFPSHMKDKTIFYSESANGTVTPSSYLYWFENVFLKYCGNERPILLIQNDSKAYFSLELLLKAIENNVIFFDIADQIKHLQPLYRNIWKAIDIWQKNNVQFFINLQLFEDFFSNLKLLLSKMEICSNFIFCGIYPFNKTYGSIVRASKILKNSYKLNLKLVNDVLVEDRQTSFQIERIDNYKNDPNSKTNQNQRIRLLEIANINPKQLDAAFSCFYSQERGDFLIDLNYLKHSSKYTEVLTYPELFSDIDFSSIHPSNVCMAIIAIQSGESCYSSAKSSEIPRKILQDILLNNSKSNYFILEKFFRLEVENILYDYCCFMGRYGCSFPRYIIIKCYKKILSEEFYISKVKFPITVWWKNFQKRFPGSVPNDISDYNTYMDRLLYTLKMSNLLNRQSQIFYCDQTYLLVFNSDTDIVSKIDMTVQICISPDGSLLPPTLFLPKIKQSGENGLMDSELYLKWFELIFLKYCGKERPVILMQDDCDDYLSVDLMVKAMENDVILFKALKKTGISPTTKMFKIIHKYPIFTKTKLFYKITETVKCKLESLIKPEEIISAFKESGICPYSKSLVTP